MKWSYPVLAWCGALAVFLSLGFTASAAGREFRAGAWRVDITPTNYPVLANAMFTERVATGAVDRLEVRSMALDDGRTRIVLAVVDTCMIPRDLIDRAKAAASRSTGVLVERMLVSATHTHSAPSAMGCLGSRADTNYARYLEPRIAEAIVGALGRLEPARIGWASVDDWEHTFNRRWIRRPDKLMEDPFGKRTVRAHMHPGHESPDAVGPSGPVDPELSVVSVQTKAGRPLALFANYSQHYYGSPLLSADYYGVFARETARLLGVGGEDSSFVGIMSQGTSGDQMWMDYGAQRREIGYEAYGREVAERAVAVARTIRHREWVPLRMAESRLALGYRVPDPARLEWARGVVAGLKGALPRTQPEIYALEALYLDARPRTELLLQAIGIGDLGIATFPNEVFALTGLKIKARSPFAQTFNVSLANGAEGYIPPPEQHALGGYTTWPARTAGLEVGAEPRIVEALLGLMEQAAGGGRHLERPVHGPYAKAVRRLRPRAYWRLEEMDGNAARDSSGGGIEARFVGGVALYLPGAGSGTGVSPEPRLTGSQFSGESINRAVHLAGGHLEAEVPAVRGDYTVDFWFWNGLVPGVRPVTGVLVSSAGTDGTSGVVIGLGGTNETRLFLRVGSETAPVTWGRSVIVPKTWTHLTMVRRGSRVALHLDGGPEAEWVGEGGPGGARRFRFGADAGGNTSLEGRLDEIAVFDRALSSKAIAGLHAASGFGRGR